MTNVKHFNPERAGYHDLIAFARDLQRQGFIFAAAHWRAYAQDQWGN